ncbi:DNA-3-methyladenine glycosidase [Vibrio sp. 10N.286.49.B3]|uniref:DNA-3-methyladenine glycosylase I n=1 Tax=Vibrio sp. 10N.286.49.B3 TaxID=1880855 RepID=UPI000C81A1A1|nr:DNA-3-methyladenine glycosylase I [Vibrio sp. 10N.286.49.B3]PMH46717.1 DNA-3-methyladenine glycosidase [Vibrio sp. 10N.286.49.B3]
MSQLLDSTCAWACNHELDREYHDKEWGVPVYDDIKLFEFLTLEGAQAGLSWLTILKKRTAYRAAFEEYDIAKLATYDESRVPYIIENYDIVRNKLKINSVYKNARATLALQEEFGSLSAALWQFVDGKPIVNRWQTMQDVPTSTAESLAMSKFLKKRGFVFVGETICYAFMQAMGLVNDHVIDCPRYHQV